VQGGLYILRRDAFLDAGGFSDVVVQNGTDIEYSYYLESCGYDLLDIPNIYSISSKTLPPTASLLDEEILAIHPLTKADGARFDRIAAKTGHYCPLCASTNDFRASNDPLGPGICADCGSSAFDRSAMRFLSLSGVLQRRPAVAMLSNRDALMKANSKVCPKFRTEHPNAKLGRSLAAALDPMPELLVIDHLEWPVEEAHEITQSIRNYVKKGGRALVGETLGETSLLEALIAVQLDMALVSYHGSVAGFDIRPIAAIGFPDTRNLARIIGTGPVGASLTHRIL
jgi:hypothetical protein